MGEYKANILLLGVASHAPRLFSESGLWAGGPGYHNRLNARGWPVQAPLGRGFSADGHSPPRKDSGLVPHFSQGGISRLGICADFKL
jgi:hypothetical protein